MVSRIVMAMALVAGTVAIGTAQAQTGVTAQGTVNSGGASSTGTVGTTSNTPRDNSSATTPTPSMTSSVTKSSPTTTGTNGTMRAQSSTQGGAKGGERQMTACLNNAASQGTSMNSCKR